MTEAGKQEPEPEQPASTNVKWAPEASPVAIEYPLDLMSRIRDHVIVGFHRLAKRGIECGGILYGLREGRRVTISQIREIRCEYKSGPSFVLSETDREALTQQLEGPDADVAGLSPVGFYVSHTKDDICATERDLAIYNQFFSDPWQVMLILRPARQGAVRAGFFVRASLGQMQIDRSYEEFQLEPPESAAENAALIAAARMPLGSPSTPPPGATGRGTAASAATGGPALHRTADFTPPLMRQPMPQPQSEPTPPPPGSGADTQRNAARMRMLQLQRPGQPQPHDRHWRWLALWFVAVAAIGAGGYWIWNVSNPSPILLRIAEQNGDLRIEWDRASSSIRNASDGLLEIRDGARTRGIKLSPEQLAIGVYLFPAGASDVVVRLSVTGFLRPKVEESANFIAQAQPGAGPRGPSEVREQRDKLLVENRRLKGEVKRLEERLKAFEDKTTAPPPQRRLRKKQQPQQPAKEPVSQPPQQQ